MIHLVVLNRGYYLKPLEECKLTTLLEEVKNKMEPRLHKDRQGIIEKLQDKVEEQNAMIAKLIEILALKSIIDHQSIERLLGIPTKVNNEDVLTIFGDGFTIDFEEQFKQMKEKYAQRDSRTKG